MKLSSLYIESHTRIGKFPKRSQYTIGKRIEDTLLDSLSLVMLARAKSERSQLLILEKIDVHLREIMILLRICEKTKDLNTTGYAVLSEQLIEIGKILGGWIKNCKTKNQYIKTGFLSPVQENTNPRLFHSLSASFAFRFEPFELKLPELPTLPLTGV